MVVTIHGKGITSMDTLISLIYSYNNFMQSCCKHNASARSLWIYAEDGGLFDTQALMEEVEIY